MTALPVPAARRRGRLSLASLRERLHRTARRLLAGPEQGWSSLLLLCVLLYTTGLAVDGVGWFEAGPTGNSVTAPIPMLMLLAGLSGALLTRLRIGAGWQHLVSAVLGSAALLILIADASSAALTLQDRLASLNVAAEHFAHDVAYSVTLTAQDRLVLLLLLAAVAWTTGTFSAYAVFGRSRAMPAIVASGALLLAAVASAVPASYHYLVLPALAAGLLVVRLNLSRQQQGWERRQIGGGRGVSTLFLAGGMAVVALTLAGAVGLAETASPAPLDQAWRQVSESVNSLVADLSKLLSGLENTEVSAVSGTFPQQQEVQSTWSSESTVVFVAKTPDQRGHYWWAAAYDTFDGTHWMRNESLSRTVSAGDDLLAGTADGELGGAPDGSSDANAAGRADVTVTITWLGNETGTMVAPAVATQADRQITVRQDGSEGPVTIFGLADAVHPGESYTTTSSALLDKDAPGALTENKLAAAGTKYPDWIEPYRTLTTNPGPLTESEAQTIAEPLAAKGEDDPFHVASAMQDLLRVKPFSYLPSTVGLCHEGQTVSDCLLDTKQGFCQQYATTMVMMLRVLGIPARYVEGYLPGTQVPDHPENFRVEASAAHAWVEVYFPTYGWIRFDPTPGITDNGDAATSFQPGEKVPGSPSPDPSLRPIPSPSPSPRPTAAAVIPPPQQDPMSGIPSELLGLPLWLFGLLVGGLALLIGGIALWVALRRFPGGSPDLAYRGVASLATRFGHGPKPTQTAYEFTQALSDVVPGVTQDLHVVARARVESVYAQRSPEGDGVRALRSAYQHARVGLLRLVFRRGSRPRP